jgi:hypothetical protein
MVTYHLTGHVSIEGELQVDLPEGVPPGEVDVIITVPAGASAWTDEEIRQMMQVTPKTGAEIAALLQEMEAGYGHIDDSAAWVEEQRHRQRDDAAW